MLWKQWKGVFCLESDKGIELNGKASLDLWSYTKWDGVKQKNGS